MGDANSKKEFWIKLGYCVWPLASVYGFIFGWPWNLVGIAYISMIFLSFPKGRRMETLGGVFLFVIMFAISIIAVLLVAHGLIEFVSNGPDPDY